MGKGTDMQETQSGIENEDYLRKLIDFSREQVADDQPRPLLLVQSSPRMNLD